jgi:coproporphyrinogen III oxidase-like Fe-S oxidoreductase
MYLVKHLPFASREGLARGSTDDFQSLRLSKPFFLGCKYINIFCIVNKLTRLFSHFSATFFSGPFFTTKKGYFATKIWIIIYLNVSLKFMSGIYTHIPFCKTICGYCDFFRSAELSRAPKFIEALKEELRASGDYLTDREVRTIYFGGGTPSTLAPELYTELIELMGEVYDLRSVEEITLEANPDDLTDDYIARLAATPINRLSIGTQSLHDDELHFMNRRHTAQAAIRAVKAAQDAGFDNISIDLIYGLPCSTTAQWRENLQTALSLNIQHISAYHLGIEPRT